MRDSGIELQSSPSNRQIDIFSPKTYAVLLNLAVILIPVWHKSLFRHSSRRSSQSQGTAGFLKLISDLYPEEFKQIQEDLGEFCAAISYQNHYETQSPAESISPLGFLALIMNPAIKTKSPVSLLATQPIGMEFVIADSNSIIHLRKGYSEITNVAEASMEVLGLFERISVNDLLMSNLDSHSRKLLSSQFLDDFIDAPDEVAQLKLIYFKFIETLVHQNNGFPQQLVNSHVLTLGELQICRELITLKEAVKQRVKLVSEARAANISTTSMLALKSTDESIDNMMLSLKCKPQDLSSDFLEETLPLLTQIHRLDTYVELLTNRLQYLEAMKVKVKERINSSKKVLTKKEQESAAETSKPDEWFHFSSVEKENLERSELELAKLESESKRIFTQIFSMLYEVSGVEKRIVQVVELPNFLRNFKWIGWLWDKIYCNKKVIVSKNNVFQQGKETQSSTIIHKYMVSSNADSRSLLVSLLKKIFTSSIENLRKSTMIWLMNEGKVALVDEIDPNLSDQTLTAALCQIVQSEGILQGLQALNNQKYLIDNLVKRKQRPAAIKLIQGILENSLITPQQHPTTVEISNALLSNDPAIALFQLPQDKLSTISSATYSLPVITTRERLVYIETAFTLMRDASIDDFGTEKYRLIQYFEERKDACNFQLNLIEEVALLSHKLEKVAKVVYTAGSGESGLAELALVDVQVFRSSDYPRISANLDLKVKQIELINRILNFKLWDSDTLLSRVADPLNMHKFIALSALRNKKLDKSARLNILISCFRNIIGNCSNVQTLFDIIYLADTQPKRLEEGLDYLVQIQKPVTRDLLQELWRSDVIWPNNAKNELTVIFKELGQKENGDSLHPEEILISFMNPSEKANLHNPFMSLLLSNASEYLDCNLAGAVNVNRERPEATPYLFMLGEFSSFWTGDLLAHISRAILKRFGPSLSTCYSLLQNIQNQQFSIAEKEKGHGQSEELDQKKDELDTLTFR